MRKPKHITIDIEGKGGRAIAKITCEGCGKIQPAETDAPYELFQRFIEKHQNCAMHKKQEVSYEKAD